MRLVPKFTYNLQYIIINNTLYSGTLSKASRSLTLTSLPTIPVMVVFKLNFN